MDEKFKLTYANMFNPPPELHTQFEITLRRVRDEMGKEYGMIISGQKQ